MRYDTDLASITCQCCQQLDSRLKLTFTERSEALINEHGIDQACAGLLLDHA